MLSALLHLGVLTIQALVLAGFTLWLFHLRSRFGLGVFLVGVASLHAVEVQTSALIQGPRAAWVVDIGAALFFAAKPFAVLLLYLREDAAEVRQLLYGLVLGSLGLLVAGLVGSAHVWIGGAGALGAFSEVMRIPALTAFGLALLVVDGVVMILLFEWLSRRLAGQFFLPVLISMVVTMALDTAIFNMVFLGTLDFSRLVLAGLIGKSYAALIYTACLWFAQRSWKAPRADADASLRDIFDRLSYRQRFEALKQRYASDVLTGLLSRAQLMTDLRHGLQPGTTVWMIDLDHFKQVNDQFGHAAGDVVLAEVARRLSTCVASRARCYRYGGEEFVAIGHIDAEQAEAFRLEVADQPIPLPDGRALSVSVTIGVARVPEPGQHANPDADPDPDPGAALQLADQQLYLGKRAGRNCVMS
jgi:diguanylate cyclase (GGDEF)-like protein